ncbi:hypothetical protein ACEPAH_5261 [Sanghuangporus vaninii]
MALSLAPSQVSVFVQDFTISRYFQAAAITSLTYDAIITMDREVKYFWNSSFRAISFVYFANRYSGLFGEITRVICKFAMWTRVVSNWFTIVLIDYILMIRVTALYSRVAKILTAVLQILLAIEVVIMLWLCIHITLIEGLTTKTIAAGMTVCGESHNAQDFGITFWSIPMVYSTILFSLALYKAVGFWMINRSLEGLTLVKVLIQDQIIYFVLAIACNLLNVMEFKLRVSNGLLSALLDTLGSPAFLCILGSRMLFNLKEAAEKGVNGDTTLKTETRMSSVHFAQDGPRLVGEESGFD